MSGSNKEGTPSNRYTRASIEVFMHDEGIFVVAWICGAAKTVVLLKKGKLSELPMVLHCFMVIYVAWFSVVFLLFLRPLSLSFCMVW